MVLSTAKYFREDKKSNKTFPAGYISEQDIDKTSIADEAVSDCNNLDFFSDYVRRRLPYDLHFDATSYLPASYKLIGSFERTFVDGAGNSKTVLIFAGKHVSDSSKKLRIYMKGYYASSDNSFQNAYKTSGVGWNDDVIELTETYVSNWYGSESYSFGISSLKNITNITQAATGVVTSTSHGFNNDDKILISGVNGMSQVNNTVFTVKNKTTDTFELYDAAGSTPVNTSAYSAYSGSGRIEGIWYISSVAYNVRINNADFNAKAENYFKGFFGVDNGEMLGIVAKSKYDAGTGYTYLLVNYGDGLILSSTGGITRFPVNNLNKDNWSNITDVEFCDTNNALKIWAGHSSKPLWLGMLANHRYFAQYSIGSQSVSNPLWNSTPAQLTGLFAGSQAETFTFKIANVLEYGSNLTISAITQANPCQVTSVGHGYVTGDIVFLTSIGGMTELNNRFYKITKIDNDNFTLDGINSTGYTAYTSGGSTKKSGNSGLPFLITIQYQSSLDATWKDLLTNVNIANYDKWFYAFSKGLSIKFTAWGFGIGYEVDVPVEKGANEISWDGLWFAFDAPEPSNKKTHIKFDNTGADLDMIDVGSNDIGKELGIRYKIRKNFEAVTTNLLYKQRIYSLAIQFDKTQGVFIKNLLCTRFDSGGQKVIPLDIFAYFEHWFDRRITSHLLFYEEFDDDKTYLPEGQLPETRQLDDNKNGFALLSSIGANIENSSYKADILNGQYELKAFANGKLLSVEYLNNYYWKSITVKAKKAIEVGRNVIAINLSQDSVNTETEKDSSLRQSNIVRDGKSTVCVSQVQRGNANTNSIMTSERLYQVIPGEELINGAATIGSQYMLFTGNSARWFELTQDSDLSIRTLATFFDKGLVSEKALVRAVISQNTQTGPVNAPLTTQFGGIFWAGQHSIYMFTDNQPIDLLEGRWKKEYQALSQVNKEAIVAGYLPAFRDVFFYTNSVIYVFNIDGKHWRKYTYSDAPLRFFAERNGNMYFITGTKIYKTEPENTAKWQDKEAETAVPIAFSLSKYYNHGSSSTNKIASLLEILYDIDTYVSGGEPTAGNIVVTAGANIATNNLLNKTLILVGNTALRQGMTSRKRARYYKLTIASNSTAANIKSIKFNEISVKAKIGRGSITKF